MAQPGPVAPNGISEGLEKLIADRGGPPSGLARISTSPFSGPAGIQTPTSPTMPSPGGYKRGHARNASLGTTMTSPSTRRRSIESTMSLIQGVLDGNGNGRIEEDESVETLTNKLAGSSVGAGGAGGFTFGGGSSSTNGGAKNGRGGAGAGGR